jgi:hypothetical protein
MRLGGGSFFLRLLMDRPEVRAKIAAFTRRTRAGLLLPTSSHLSMLAEIL